MQEVSYLLTISSDISEIRVDDMKNVIHAARKQAKSMIENFEEKCKKREVSSPEDICV